jgi:hypothetical protein
MKIRCGVGRNGGRGFATSDASGFPIRAQDRVRDVRQGIVSKSEADWSGPRFGTNHPMDFFDPGDLDDPTPIPFATPSQTAVEMKLPSPVNAPYLRLDGFTPEDDE